MVTPLHYRERKIAKPIFSVGVKNQTPYLAG